LVLSGLSTLTYLNVANNQLTSLNLTGLTNLVTLGLSNNKLTTLTLPATLAFANNVQIINCNLDITTLNQLLSKLVNTNSLTGGFLFMAGNIKNTETDGYIATLANVGGRNWTVTTV
jgi:Leucine-rich repeat (LRR) protein